MKRRGFLGLLAGAAVGVAASEDLADMLAPRKTIILPPRVGWPVQPAWDGQLGPGELCYASPEFLKLFARNYQELQDRLIVSCFFPAGDVRRYGAMGDHAMGVVKWP